MIFAMPVNFSLKKEMHQSSTKIRQHGVFMANFKHQGAEIFKVGLAIKFNSGICCMLMKHVQLVGPGISCLNVGRNARTWLLSLAVCILPGISRAATGLTADEIIQKAVTQAEQAGEKAARKDFTYTKVSITEELDSRGKVKDRKEKVFRVHFQRGENYAKLVEVNGKPVGKADSKNQAEAEANTSKMMGGAKPTKGEKTFLTPDVASRYNFKLVGRKIINERESYEIALTPKTSELPESRVVDRLMNRISGTVWIDTQEFELARVDLTLGSEVNLLGGVVGSLKKLVYTMTRTRMADGLWLSSSTSGDFEGRKLIDGKHIKTRSHMTGFKLLS